MILYERHYNWTPEDTRRDIPFAFCCPSNIKRLLITFTFSPGAEQQPERCEMAVERALTRYYDRYPREIQPMQSEQFFPIKNLITLSLERQRDQVLDRKKLLGLHGLNLPRITVVVARECALDCHLASLGLLLRTRRKGKGNQQSFDVRWAAKCKRDVPSGILRCPIIMPFV